MLSVGAVPARAAPRFRLPAVMLKSPTGANGSASLNVISTTFVLAWPSVPPIDVVGVWSVSAASATAEPTALVTAVLPSAPGTPSGAVYVPVSAQVTAAATTFQ